MINVLYPLKPSFIFQCIKLAVQSHVAIDNGYILCLQQAHMFITPYKRLLMIPCELFMSYGFSYDRMNQNLFLIKESKYKSVL